MTSNKKIWLILGSIVVVAVVALIIWLVSRKPDISDQVVLRPVAEPIDPLKYTRPALSYEQVTAGYRMTLPSGWLFFDVGLAETGSLLIDDAAGSTQKIYLQHESLAMVMDVEVESEFDRTGLPLAETLEFVTRADLTAILHIGNCAQGEEPWFIIHNNAERSLHVTLDEVCEEDEKELIDFETLLMDVANNFEFIN
jgi:hypothetical protein